MQQEPGRGLFPLLLKKQRSTNDSGGFLNNLKKISVCSHSGFRATFHVLNLARMMKRRNLYGGRHSQLSRSLFPLDKALYLPKFNYVQLRLSSKISGKLILDSFFRRTKLYISNVGTKKDLGRSRNTFF